jgi:N,N'-diacetyllegionaminate synthase
METFIIAEIAQAHEGSLGILHSYIDALATTGVNAIKFQTHIAEAESSVHEPFRVNFSYVDQTRYDYWKRMEFSPEQWAGIKSHCEDKGVEFLSSPFSIRAVELLEALEVKRYKIASGEITNFLLLEKIAQTRKPVILSSGMSDLKELAAAVKFFQDRSIEISVLQCTTMYPTPPEHLGLNVIPILKDKFKCKVGFSDHSGQTTACVAARTMGADILEFHAVFDKRMFGPDATSSLTIDEIGSLVKQVRYLEKALNFPVDKNDTARYEENKKIFGKSLAVNDDLPKGHILVFENLESKKPAGHGIPAAQFVSVIGRKLNKNLMKYSFLSEDDLERE